MPTRIVREGILTSERVNALSERAELFYRRLMSVADDHGRYYAHPGILRAACFPLRLNSVCEADVKQMLSECEAVGLLAIYGGKYVQLYNFGQQTRSKSKFPEPAENELLSKCKSNDKQMLSLVGVGVGVEDGVVVGGGENKTTTTTISELPNDPTYGDMARYLMSGHREYAKLSEHQIIAAFSALRGTVAKANMADAVRELVRHYAGDANLEMAPIKRLESYLRGATLNKRHATGSQNNAPGIDARLLNIKE